MTDIMKLISSRFVVIITLSILLMLQIYIRWYCFWNTTYTIMPLILLICIVAYIILAAPLFLRGLGLYPITDYIEDAARLFSTLMPPVIIVTATWGYHCPYWFGFLWPDWLEKMYQQQIIISFAIPMALCTAAILIFYLLSYFHFGGDTNDQP